jgi:hypothetical protein
VPQGEVESSQGEFHGWQRTVDNAPGESNARRVGW